MRSLACWSGRWKCGANRPPLDAMSDTISGVQSIGSSELMRNMTSSRAGIERAQQIDERDRRRSGRVRTSRGARRSARCPCSPALADPFDLRHDRLDRQAPSRPTRRRDDAVGAALLAAGLHAQREGGAAGRLRAPEKTRTGRLPNRTGPRSSPARDARPGRGFRPVGPCPRLVTMRTTPGSAAASSGCTRRLAAGDDDFGRWVVAGDSPDGLAGALVGAGGDRAGVHDHDVGIGCRSGLARRAAGGPLRCGASPPGSPGSRR